MFLGSEECFMELEGSYFDENPLAANSEEDPTEATQPITESVTIQIEHWERHLKNLNISPSEVLLRYELPERSQSSLSYVNQNKLMCSTRTANKLGAQHAVEIRTRKLSRNDFRESMDLPHSLLKKRRSRSADSRFSSDFATYVGIAKCDSSSSHSRRQIPGLSSSFPTPVPEIRIQINGEGVEI